MTTTTTVNRKPATWNTPLLWILLVIYTGMIILFAVQTWLFVNWLFPGDLLIMKCLTMLSFDVLALVYAAFHTFYRFHSRGAKSWVQIAWVVTFVLSLLASILYLVILDYFRMSLVPDVNYIYVGDAVSIIALVFNVLAVMSVLILEYRAINPRADFFEDETESIDTPAQKSIDTPHRQYSDGSDSGEYQVIASNGNGASKNGRSRPGK